MHLHILPKRNNMKWQKITVSTSHDFEELVSMAMLDFGSEGVGVTDYAEFRDAVKNRIWDYIDEKLLEKDDGTVLVSGYFPIEFDKSLLEKELAEIKSRSPFAAGSLETQSETVDSATWENVWKDYYKPIKSGKITIVPKWLENPNKDTLPVYINPGMAFGTGSHETTGMCVELMQLADMDGKSVADVGCGSGILGICSLMLGAKSCTFVDNDENAVSATKENCGYNKVVEHAKIVHGSLLDGENEKFDVVLANLTVDLLLMLKGGIDKNLKSGGSAVLSGIINGRESEILRAFESDYKLLKTERRGEWHAMLMQKL